MLSSVINEMNICDEIKSLYIHLGKNGREYLEKFCKKKREMKEKECKKEQKISDGEELICSST